MHVKNKGCLCVSLMVKKHQIKRRPIIFVNTDIVGCRLLFP